MSDLAHIDLTEKAYTPEEVWVVVDRIPNTATTHWNIFGLKVLPAVMKLLLKDHERDAYDIAHAWASRSPKFSQKYFDQRWLQLIKSPLTTPGMRTLERLADGA